MMPEMIRKMSEFKIVGEYINYLMKRLEEREPGIVPNLLERVYPIGYILNPVQEIPLDKIDNMPDSAIVTKHGLEQYAKEGREPMGGAYHGIRFGRQVDIPIAVTANEDGTFSINEGFHRAVQVFINGDKTIWAFVEGGTGKTLKEIFNSIKNPNLKI